MGKQTAHKADEKDGDSALLGPILITISITRPNMDNMERSQAASFTRKEVQAEADTPALYEQAAKATLDQQSAKAGVVVPNSVLPPGMTRDQVQQIYQKYQQMKAEGVPENDGELAKAHAILQSIQQKVEMVKKQQATHASSREPVAASPSASDDEALTATEAAEEALPTVKHEPANPLDEVTSEMPTADGDHASGAVPVTEEGKVDPRSPVKGESIVAESENAEKKTVVRFTSAEPEVQVFEKYRTSKDTHPAPSLRRRINAIKNLKSQDDSVGSDAVLREDGGKEPVELKEERRSSRLRAKNEPESEAGKGKADEEKRSSSEAVERPKRRCKQVSMETQVGSRKK